MARNPLLDDPNFDPLADEFDEVETGRPQKKAADDEFAKLLAQETQTPFTRLKAGDQIEAKVVAVGETSVFVDVGQRAEGAVDLIEFSPEERAVLAPGVALKLWVASVSGGSVELTKSLSARQMSRETLGEALATGVPVTGKVSAENKGGWTVEVAGVRAFVPYSQMDVGPRQPASEYLGKTFEFRVVQIKGRDVVLSRAAILREKREAEQAEMLAALKVGAVVKGRVTKVEKFGAFVDIGSGLSVLIPNSEMSWSRAQSTGVISGEQVSCKIIRIETPDGGRPRIAASIKQLDGDPWERNVEAFASGKSYPGVVTRLMQFGAFVELAPGIEGLVHISEMSARRRIHQPGEVVSPGQEVTVRVLNIDPENKRISLSLKALEAEVLDEETRAKFVKAQDSDSEHRGVELVTPATGGSALADAWRRAEEKRRQKT